MTGTRAWPPLIIGNLLAWLTICSKTSSSRNGIWYSTTGRIPAMAAPVAKFVTHCSDSGVSTILSGPNRSYSPTVTLVSACLTSSPSTNTAGSRSISAASAWLSARV